MGETTDQIAAHIEMKRQQLQSNFIELAQKLNSATDWRYQFRNHTATMIAAAFGAGMLLSVMVGRNRTAGSPAARALRTDDTRRLRKRRHSA